MPRSESPCLTMLASPAGSPRSLRSRMWSETFTPIGADRGQQSEELRAGAGKSRGVRRAARTDLRRCRAQPAEQSQPLELRHDLRKGIQSDRRHPASSSAPKCSTFSTIPSSGCTTRVRISATPPATRSAVTACKSFNAAGDGQTDCLTGNAFLHPVNAHRPRTMQFALKLSF